MCFQNCSVRGNLYHSSLEFSLSWKNPWSDSWLPGAERYAAVFHTVKPSADLCTWYSFPAPYACIFTQEHSVNKECSPPLPPPKLDWQATPTLQRRREPGQFCFYQGREQQGMIQGYWEWDNHSSKQGNRRNRVTDKKYSSLNVCLNNKETKQNNSTKATRPTNAFPYEQ